MLVPLIAFAGDMMVVGGIEDEVSLVALEKPMGIGAMDDRFQLWLGGVRISGTLIDLKPAMAATALGERAREEAVRRVLPLSLKNIFWFWNGTIEELWRPLNGHQMKPSLPKIDVGGVFCPGDCWVVRFLIKNFIRLVALGSLGLIKLPKCCGSPLVGPVSPERTTWFEVTYCCYVLILT